MPSYRLARSRRTARRQRRHGASLGRDRSADAPALTPTGRRVVDGAILARFAERNAGAVPDVGPIARESARNRFVGLVTRVVRDTVMAQVEMQCGPYRVVSLMSREAADELGLQARRARDRLGEVDQRRRRGVRTYPRRRNDAQVHSMVGGAGRCRRSRSGGVAACSSSGSASGSSGCVGSLSGSITVFAASSLTEAFTTLGDQFLTAHPGTTVDVQLRRQFDARRPTSPRARRPTCSPRHRPTNMDTVVSGRRRRTPTNFVKNAWRSRHRRAIRPASSPWPTSPSPGVKVALCDPAVPCGVDGARGVRRTRR